MTLERDTPDGTTTFEDAVAAEMPSLYRYARSIASNQAEAEDLVGETALRALERRSQFRGESSLRTWLHRILYHLAIDRARHGAHEVHAGEVANLWRTDSYTIDAETVVERAESADEMHDALVHVPQHYRSVVVLHDAEGWPVREIATLLHISIPAAKQRLRRGRMMLVSALAHGVERQVANRGVPLTCWRARREVSDYLDEELEPAERAALEAHLATCATCPPLYQGLVSATTSLDALHDPDTVVPLQLARRIEEHLGRSRGSVAGGHVG